MTCVLNQYIILAGRFLYGFSTGLIAVAMPRYLDEILPPRFIGLFGGLYCFSFAIATIIAFFLAIGLPPDKIDNVPNTDALRADEFWRVIFGLPIVFYLLQDILACCFCKFESPKFLLL